MNQLLNLFQIRDKTVFLAPMEEITDSAFRRICRTQGADAVVSEFISSEALVRSASKTVRKLNFFPEEKPIGIQIYGNRPEAMAEAAKIVSSWQPDFIDINAGCPVKKIVKNGNGAALLKDLPLFGRIVDAVRQATNLPVTVKMRLGWDKNSIVVSDVIPMLTDLGVTAVFIHGRTRDQMYKGEADWSWIGQAADMTHIPVIGNGDIKSASQVLSRLWQYPQLCGVMIGRGAVGRPWLFRSVQNAIENARFEDMPELAERITILKQHLLYSVEERGERTALLIFRKHYAGYIKGEKYAAQLRAQLMRATTLFEVYSLLDNFLINAECVISNN